MTDSAPVRPVSKTFRVPDDDLDDLASTLAKTMAEVRQHSLLLDRLSAEPKPVPADSAPGTHAADNQASEEEPASVFILALGGEAYETEIGALSNWVNLLLLPFYGREISTTRPWCEKWPEHPEAVARLHALWLAWQQLTDSKAGLSGPSTWHRDHLDHAFLQLRAPDGPFAACTTSQARPHHRVLAAPGPATSGTVQ